MDVDMYIATVPNLASPPAILLREGYRDLMLLVARIKDGEHAGKLHIYDGGTRYKLGMATVGPDHVMPCWVEDMKLAEAAGIAELLSER